MKQKLRLGDGYALTKHKRKQYTIRYLSLLAVVMSMCLYAVKQVSAQQAEPAATAVADIKPLQIGDTIPAYFWQLPLRVVNHPDGKSRITLNEHRGKLIILDFWATWCAPCLKSLDKLDTLRHSLHPDLAFLPVAYEKEEAVTKVLKARNWEMPTIVDEHRLDIFFPHRVVPHLVWIYDGKVRAYTDPGALTHGNIEAILQDNTFKLTEKTDKEPDYFKPIIGYAQQKKVADFVQSAITGYTPDIGGMGVRSRDSLTVQYLLNSTLSEMYRIALGVSFERFIVEGDTPLIYDDDLQGRSKSDYLYCYQIIVPPEMPAAKRYQKMVTDLNAYFGLTTVFEERDAECYIIKPIDGNVVNNINAHTQEERRKTFFTLNQFVKSLNHAGKLVEYMPLFVNESDVDIRIPSVPHPSELKYDIPQLRQILSNYGLTMEKSTRPHTFLVIRKASEPSIHLN